MSFYRMVQLLQLPKNFDRRGNLSFLESNKHIPFDIKRTYWIYDVPGGETRGGHAYKNLHEIVIALSGSFDVHVESAAGVEKYSLNRSYMALYLPPGTWRSLQNFSTNAVCMVAASEFYDENDYIRDYQKFKTFIYHG
jgi:dTDP-4-dehydrorhamnose 3,5-epimerase-like enzyme